MTKKDWELIKQYIDTKIDYEIARREEDSEGYMVTARSERKLVEAIEDEINKYLT